MRSHTVKIMAASAMLLLFCFSATVFAAEPVIVEQPAYKIEINRSTDAKGSKAVSIKVFPKENSKLNPEFPTKLSIKAPVGFLFAKDSFGAGDFSKYLEKAFEISLPYNDLAAKESGDLIIEFRFGTCTVANGQTKSCMMQNWKMNFKLEAPATR